MDFDSWEDFISTVSVCQRCRLCEGRTKVVPGAGDTKADIMFIGEGPGKDEDIQGEPFVGRAGKLLNEMLQEVLGLERKDIYIANVVKCRPPDNRDPLDDEIESCEPFLDFQIKYINPKVIATLGRFSMEKFLPGVKISQVHGEAKRRQSDGRIIFPMYHPAVALYRGSMKEELRKDFQKLKKLLETLKTST